MKYLETVYQMKCIRIMFDKMNEAIKGKIIYDYYKQTLGDWFIEVTAAEKVVGIEKIYKLKKEILQAYLSL